MIERFLSKILSNEFDESLLHVLGFVDKPKSALIQLVKQLLTDVAPVSEQVPEDASGRFRHKLAIVNVSRSQLEDKPFTAIGDHQV